MTRKRKTIILITAASILFITSAAYAETAFCYIGGAELLVWSQAYDRIEKKDAKTADVIFAAEFMGYCLAVVDSLLPEYKNMLREVSQRQIWRTVSGFLKAHPLYHGTCAADVVIEAIKGKYLKK